MKPLRVLLVEDDPTFAKLLQVQLGVLDAPRCEVVRERTLAGARARLAAERFDVVLSDMGLSDSRGVGTVEAIEAAAGGTPVVILSGSDEPPPGRRFLRKGGIGPEDLAQALRDATGGGT